MKLPLLLLVCSLPSLALSAEPHILSSLQDFFDELKEFAGFKVVKTLPWTQNELAIVNSVAQRRPADFITLLDFASSFKGETLPQVREDVAENESDHTTFLESLSFQDVRKISRVLTQLRRVKEPIASVKQHLLKSITYLRDDLAEKANALSKPSYLKYFANLYWTLQAGNTLVLAICPDVQVSTHLHTASWMQQTADGLFDCLQKRVNDDDGVDTRFKLVNFWKETLITIRIFRHSVAEFVKGQQQVNEQSEHLEPVQESKNLDTIEAHADQLISVLGIFDNRSTLTLYTSEDDVIGKLNELSKKVESDRLQKRKVTSNQSVQPLNSKEEKMEHNESPFQIGEFFF